MSGPPLNGYRIAYRQSSSISYLPSNTYSPILGRSITAVEGHYPAVGGGRSLEKELTEEPASARPRQGAFQGVAFQQQAIPHGQPDRGPFGHVELFVANDA